MKLTKGLMSKIEKIFSRLDPDKEFEIETGELKVGDEVVTVFFPRDDVRVSVKYLLKYLDDLEFLEFNVSKVSSPRFTQMPVYCSGKPLELLISEIDFVTKINGAFTIRLVEHPLLIGIAATKLGIWDKFALPCSAYIAVEVQYDSDKVRLSPEEELKTIRSYLFELSNLCGASVDFNVIHESGAFDEYEEPVTKHVTWTSLTSFSEGMDLFRKAINSEDQEIAFLYFYKIIEYYSPIAAKATSYEVLLKKIEALKSRDVTSTDLSAIFMIADKYRNALSDRYLSPTLLSHAVDIVELFSLLPNDVQKGITKTVHFNKADLNYHTSPEIIQGIFNQVGAILYSTRNSIVHAKSNYRSDGLECTPDDLPTINVFLKAACYSVIRWNSRLPAHLKFDE